MRCTILVLIMCILLFSCIYSTVSAPSPLSSLVVRLDRATVELGPDYCVGENFTLTAKIDNFYDLGAIDLMLEWNTTFLDYVDHITKTPVEVYPDGVLHEPIIIFYDDVNASRGTYYVAVSSLYPAPSFYGSGIVFEITFRVKYQPLEPETFPIAFIQHGFITYGSGTPAYSVENCSVTIYPWWNPADVNDDLKVDIFDLVLGANAYQATPSDPHWNPRCDIANPYEIINIFDIVTIALSYGEEYVS